jgi:uncharacterized protein (DUF1697 family)
MNNDLKLNEYRIGKIIDLPVEEIHQAMKYIALLRGINVGGNNIIKMADLVKTVEKCGFTNVKTYIQSGNVLFESAGKNKSEIVEKLEAALLKDFNYNSRIIVKTHEQLKKIAAEVPPDWEKRNDLRCYIAFVAEPVTVQDVMQEIELNEGIDFLKTGESVLYMSTLLSGLTRSRFTRLITRRTYKDISIRNYNTVRKLLELMD